MKGWTVVFRGPEYVAETAAAALEAAGFRVETMTDTGHLWPGLIGDQTRIFVPDDEAERALRLLDSEYPPAS